MMVMLCSSLFVFACNDNTQPSEVNVSFATLKTIVAGSEEISDWKGLNVTTLNASREVVGSFKSTKQIARTSDVVVDFIHEKGNYKIYCDNNVRYYYEDTRKYLDEVDFNYSEYEQELLKDCLSDIEEFFENDKNSDNLLNSSKLDKEDNIEYTFEILLDKDTNKKLVATYICDKHNKLIMIKVSISEDNKDKIDTEVSENDEIIVTPDWFKSDDYKTTITLEEMYDIVFASDLFDGWTSAYVKDEIMHSLGWEGENYKYNEYHLSKENSIGDENVMVCYNDTDKSYIIDGVEYVYKNNLVDSIINHEENYTFEEKLASLFYSFFAFSFEDGETMERYYTHSKRYEKDRTIYAFRLFDDASSNPNIEIDEEAYGALYFDVNGNFYKAEYRMVAVITNYEERTTVIEKKNTSVETPEWFNENDFENL